MQLAVSLPQAADVTSHAARGAADLAHLEHLIEHAGHLLPEQGPITVFIHHNTLHALEERPFEEAVQKGARIYGCQPFLAEDDYRRHSARGRIRREDIAAVLREDLGDA